MSFCTESYVLKRRIFKAVLLVIIAAAFAPFVIAARYAVFQPSDDFSFYLGVMRMPGENYIVKAIRFALELYPLWQGTYTTNLLNCLLNPLSVYSYAMLRLELIMCLLLSCLAVYLLCREMTACFSLGDKTLPIFAVVFLPILLYTDYNEVYLWFIGAMAYLVPMMLLIFALALMLRCKRKGKTSAMIFSALLMLGMAGGVLMIGGLGAYLMLIMCAADFAQNGKLDRRLLFIFAAAVIGDLINTLAPGNFVRHTSYGSASVVKALGMALLGAANEAKILIFDNGVIIFLVIAFAMGMSCPNRLRRTTFFGTLLGMLMAPVVTLFPMMLGYNSSTADGASLRGFFVLDASIILSAETICFLIGSKVRVPEGSKMHSKVIAVCAAAVLTLVYSPKLVNSIPVQISENLSSGKIQAYSEQTHEMYDMLRLRPGEDIVIVELPDPCVGVLELRLKSDPNYTTNADVAAYFGNNSICDGYYAAHNPRD